MMQHVSPSSPATAATGDKPWHLVFDLDGTLLDTLDDIALAANRAIADFNPNNPKQFDRTEVRRMIGDGSRILMQRIFTASEQRSPKKEEMDQCHQLFLQRYVFQSLYNHQSRSSGSFKKRDLRLL